MKFSKDQKEKIKLTKKVINGKQKVQDKLFNDLCIALKIDAETEDWLFDYIFNNFGTIKTVENKGQIRLESKK